MKPTTVEKIKCMLEEIPDEFLKVQKVCYPGRFLFVIIVKYICNSIREKIVCWIPWNELNIKLIWNFFIIYK